MPKVLAAATASLLLLSATPLAAKQPRAALEKAYLELNEQCRGGSGDDPDTLKACDEREKVSAQLRQIHVCFVGDRFQYCSK